VDECNIECALLLLIEIENINALRSLISLFCCNIAQMFDLMNAFLVNLGF